MTAETLPHKPSFLNRNLFFGISPATLLVIIIMLLSLTLHLINIGNIRDANAYYTAAVKSMLQSWHNFFFAAAEPGGSVSVDKPPLGLWIEAVFAYFLGVSGLSVSLPNILAGVFGVPLLYVMVRKYMGDLAGLVAALAMTVTPVFVATNRNNTMDGMLVFVLLLAAWAFIKATESGKARWLFLGAFIVGLGFNIKMLQAFLPLPAFYALYFLGSKEDWFRKMVNLGLATALLAAVSLSWAIAVDLTPADQRPYVGSSSDNTVMGLILGHNGTSRLFVLGSRNDGPRDGGQAPNDGQFAPPQNRQLPFAPPDDQIPPQGFQPPFPPLNGQTSPQGFQPPIQDGPFMPDGQIQPQGNPGAPFSHETGVPGVLRFFTRPLSKQMSWLLPFALISLALAIFGNRIHLPLRAGGHKAFVLWGGWLVTCLVFFSAISGIFHAYYAIMLVPPLGAVVGMGFAQLWQWQKNHSWAGILLVLAAVATFVFQVFASAQYGKLTGWFAAAGVALLIGSILLVPALTRRVAYATILMAMLIVPVYWTTMTIFASNPNVNLPTAYSGVQGPGQAPDNRARDAVLPSTGQPTGANVKESLLAYLEANTQGVKYLVAVPSSQNGAQLVLATGRPVLYMGGFTGQDQVVSAGDLADMVANGELRYVLYGVGMSNRQDIQNWLATSCAPVPEFSQMSTGGPGLQNGQLNQPGRLQDGRPNQSLVLYRCD